MTLLAVLAILVVGGGAAVAHDGYGGSESKRHDRATDQSQQPRGAQRGGAKWRAFKQLTPSSRALVAYMTGAAEVNDEGDDGAGDPNGKGTASFLVVDEQTLCYGFSITGAEPPTAVHIHRGQAGENGDVVIPFANPPKDANGQAAGDPGASSGCKVLTDQSERDALRRILSRPKGYYVNIHTPSFEAGAVRGQLARVWFDNQPD